MSLRSQSVVSHSHPATVLAAGSLRPTYCRRRGCLQTASMPEAKGITPPEDLGLDADADVPDVLDGAIGTWFAGRIARGVRASLPPAAERIRTIWWQKQTSLVQ